MYNLNLLQLRNNTHRLCAVKYHTESKKPQFQKNFESLIIIKQLY